MDSLPFNSWSRRKFLGQLTAAGAAGLIGLRPGTSAAEPPPETTSINIVYDPNEEITIGSAVNKLGNFFYKQDFVVQQACLVEENCPDIPIMDCENNQGIIFISGEENGYSQEDKCLRMTAVDSFELEKLTEKLIYRYLGVI